MDKRHEPPSFEQLIAHALGEESAEDRATLETALRRAPGLAAELSRLQAVLATLAGDDSAAPSAAVVRRVVERFRREPEGGRLDWLDRARHFVARCVLDTWGQPALAGFRGGSGDRMLAYESEVGRVDLQATAVGDRVRLRGQLRRTSGDRTADVALLEAGRTEPTAEGRADAHGRFELEAGPGAYDVFIECDDGNGVMIIRNLEVS